MVSRDPYNPMVEIDVTQNPRRNTSQYQKISYPCFDDPMRGIINQNEISLTHPPLGPSPEDFPDLHVAETSITYNNSGVQVSITPNPITSTVGLPGNITATRVVAPGSLRNWAISGTPGP